MYFNKKAFIAIIAAGVAATGITSTAHAEDGSRQIEINTLGFDLTSEEGVEDLRRAVRRAAKRVCERKGTRGAAVMALERQCRDETLERTEVQVAAVIDSRNNRPVMVSADPIRAPRPPAR